MNGSPRGEDLTRQQAGSAGCHATDAGFFAYCRNLLGVCLKDWRRYRDKLSAADASYLTICNRSERLEPSADGTGYRCDWQWTSDLHAPKFLPSLGLRLMERALSDHPIRRVSAPDMLADAPEVSFIIGHRGLDRLPHLLATLESIAGQQGASVECLVVEQDVEPRIAGSLPAWVRHIHTPPPAAEMPYCRSWTFNIGVKHAKGAVFVLHDNDMLVPADYSANILKQIEKGHEVANLKRFIFYLSEQHTQQVFSGKAGLADQAPLTIVQNLEAGGSVVITRQAYDRIGGMDESFIGWGGEDNEFWERAQTLKVWPYAYLPIVHLWHSAQPGKNDPRYHTHAHYLELSKMAPEQRVLQLKALPRGMLDGPITRS